MRLNTGFQLFKNPFKKDPMEQMKLKPEPIERKALPINDFVKRLATEMGAKMSVNGMLEAKAVTGKDLYPKVITENHDALMKSPQFKGLKVDKERFAYFLGVNFFCLGVIHHHWEQQLGKTSDRFTAEDTEQMNNAVRKKKDNYALAFEYLGQQPKSEYGQTLAKLLNDMSEKANALSAGKMTSDKTYSRAYSQVMFQAGYAQYAETLDEE